jgi:hypothetical protein
MSQRRPSLRFYPEMLEFRKHHNSALCHISAVHLTRMTSCWKSQERYVIRDTDGRAITPEEGRRIFQAHYQVSASVRELRRTTKKRVGTGRRSKESQSAPSTGPSGSEIRAGAAGHRLGTQRHGVLHPTLGRQGRAQRP